ncbi:MAG: tetratricopeptide repeat protein [Desulfobulbaceae bacterium]|nr:tetratricopeptide repeat protein [Desulfobulbaceae bacterium]
MTRAHHLKTFLSILTIAILISVVYSNSISVPFQFDDYPNIIDSKFIKISRLQIDALSQAATAGQASHRWLPNITFAIQYYFSGLTPPAYHFFNITLHFFCATVLYFLLLTTLDYAGTADDKIRKNEIALVATILWSLHPLQTNAVTYIVQRMTSMSTLFYLSAMFLYARGRRPNQPVFRQYQIFSACAISAILAITSKENAAMLPLLLIAYEIFIISPSHLRNNRLLFLFTFVGTGLLLLLLAWLWIGDNIYDRIQVLYQERYFSLSERLMTEPRVIFFYLSLLAFPSLSRLNIDHDILISSTPLAPPTTLLAIGGLLLLIYSIRYLFTRDRILSFAILWFLLNLAIESSFIPLELCFEHRLYNPSSLLIFALVLLMYRWSDRQLGLLRLAIVVVAISLGLLTWNRNLVWQSQTALWADALAKSPNLLRPYVNLGDALRLEQKYPQAETYLRQALDLDANRKVDHNRLIWSAEMSPVHTALADVYFRQNKFPEALYHSEEALRLNPTALLALLTKGFSLVQEGQYQPANYIFTRLAADGVDTVELYKYWGICAAKSGDKDRAIILFRHAVSLDPNNPESHYNLGLAYGEKGMLADATREMSFGMGQQNSPRH